MALITKPNTFSAGAVIIAAQHNDNFDTIYNDYNGNITNANLSASAGIVDTKLATISTSQKVNLSALVATSQAQGDVVYASSSTVFTRLAKDTNATRYLTNTGTDNNPAWGLVNLANGVTGTLPVANGGTGAASQVFDYGTSNSVSAAVTSLKMAFGSLSITGNASVTITGLPFASAAAYKVVVSRADAAVPGDDYGEPNALRTNGTTAVIYNTSSSTLVLNWFAIGA